MSTPEYRVAPSKENPKQGLGLYSRHSYHKSELIFIEEPLVRVPYKSSQPFMKQLWRHVANDISGHPIVNAFRSMNRYDQKDFLRLHNSRKDLLTRADFCPPDLETDRNVSGPTCAFELLGIYLTNFFFLHEDVTGVFKSISRINHACAANAYLVWDRTNGEMRVIAASSIIAGSEITIDYSEKFAKQLVFSMLANIREHCRYFYGFWCRCRFCLENFSKGSIREVSPQQERDMVSFHLDGIEEKLLLKKEAPCWEIKELGLLNSSSGSTGLPEVGVFATRRILKGEPIHGESPMFSLELHPEQLKGTSYIPSIMAAVRNLDSTERDAYLSLRMRDPGVSGFSLNRHHSTSGIDHLKEIFLSNAICLPTWCQKEGYCEWGIFRDLSRVNHSCMPNAIGLTYDRTLRGSGQRQHWLHARKDIECGEEITFCYVDEMFLEADVKVRARTLKDRFICWCWRCAYDRHDTPHPQEIDSGCEIPTDYPKAWVERINTLPVTASDQRQPQEGKDIIALRPSLVFSDVLIELNNVSQKERVIHSAKKTGKRAAVRIFSLPSTLDIARRDILKIGIGRERLGQNKEILQRRIKFQGVSSMDGNLGLQPGEVKGKQRAVSVPVSSADWATMSAIMVRQNSQAEASWCSGGTTYPPNPSQRSVSLQPFSYQKFNPISVTSEGSNPPLGSGVPSIRSTSTSIELWESLGPKIRSGISTKQLSSQELINSQGSDVLSLNLAESISIQSRKTIPFMTQGDLDLPDQYYMSRLGVEQVTAERLQRANSLSLKSPVGGGLENEDSNSAAVVDGNKNGSSVITRNEAIQGTVTEASASPSTDTVVGQSANSARKEIVYRGNVPSLDPEPVSPVVLERYRGSSFTIERGFVGPKALRINTTEEGLMPRSVGPSFPPRTNREIPPFSNRPAKWTTYQSPTGSNSKSWTDRSIHQSSRSQLGAPGRQIHSGLSMQRGSNQSFPGRYNVAPHSQRHRRCFSSRDPYTDGLPERSTNERIQSRGRIQPTGSSYGSFDRNSIPRPRQPDRQFSTNSVSRSAAREARPSDQTHQRYLRPQSRVELSSTSFGTENQVMEEPLVKDEVFQSGSEPSFQRGRGLSGIAGVKLPPSPHLPQEPMGFGMSGQGTNKNSVGSVAPTIEYPPQFRAVTRPPNNQGNKTPDEQNQPLGNVGDRRRKRFQ